MKAVFRPTIKYPDQIIGEKTILREFTEKNLYDPLYLKWLKDPLVMDTIGRREFLKEFSFREVEKYYYSIRLSDNKMFFAIYTKSDKFGMSQFIGTYKLDINWDDMIANIGTMIGDKENWGKGFFQDTTYHISKYAFDVLKIRKMSCGCLARNVPVIHSCEKIGYKREALFRKSVLGEDIVYLGMFPEELRKP
jgi:ribosomal-protein-alanine N-acetyltransferase